MSNSLGKSNRAGFTLVEVVLALALSIFVVMLVFNSQWSIGNSFSRNIKIINQLNEAVGELAVHLNSLDSTAQVRPYSRCESLLVPNQDLNFVSGFGLLRPDLGLAEKYGKDCGAHVRSQTNQNFLEVNSVSAGFDVSSVDAVGDNVFVGLRSNTTSLPNDNPDIGVFLASDPSQTSFIDSGVDAGLPGAGINKIDATDGYIYSANKSTSTQVSIFRVSVDGAGFGVPNIALLATSTLPGVAGSRPEAVSIFYFDQKIYVGTKRTAGNEFHIFDASNPSHPVWLGSREMNHNINDIVVKDGLAFLATSGNIRDLIVLDVHDPTSISQVLAVDIDGNEDGRSVLVSGNYIFLGRYKATAPGHNELVVLTYEISDQTGSTQISEISSVSIGGDVTGIVQHAGLIVLSTTNTTKELQALKISPSMELIPFSSTSLPTVGAAVETEGDRIFVGTGQEIKVFD